MLTAELEPTIRALGGTVLDIGGGRDSPLAALWPATASRIRLDISSRFQPTVLGDAQHLPLRSSSIDGAVMSEVLEHIPDPGTAITEVRRALRPGSLFCGSVPFGIGVHADPHDYFRYTHEALQGLLTDFDDVEVRAHGNHLGVAWRALNERWHWLWILNPLVRPLIRKPDVHWPVGYTFTARKSAEAYSSASTPTERTTRTGG